MAVCGTSDCKNIFIKHIKSYEIACSNLEKDKRREKKSLSYLIFAGTIFLDCMVCMHHSLLIPLLHGPFLN